MTDNKLSTCTLQQALNWILCAKKPERVFESNETPDLDESGYTEKQQNKALTSAKNILLQGFYDDIIHPIGSKWDGSYDWEKPQPIPGLVNCKYIDFNIEQNTIFFTESPDLRIKNDLYGFIEIPLDELQKLIPEGKSLLKPISPTPTTYVFPKNVLISEYMSVVLEILLEGKINTDDPKQLPNVKVIQRWIETKYKQKYPHEKPISQNLIESLATALRPANAIYNKWAYAKSEKSKNKQKKSATF